MVCCCREQALLDVLISHYYMLCDIEIRRNLVVVAGVGGVAGDIAFGDHAHLQEGAEDEGVVVQNGLLELDGQLSEWAEERQATGMLLDVIGAVLIIVVGALCAFSTWRVMMAG